MFQNIGSYKLDQKQIINDITDYKEQQLVQRNQNGSITRCVHHKQGESLKIVINLQKIQKIKVLLGIVKVIQTNSHSHLFGHTHGYSIQKDQIIVIIQNIQTEKQRHQMVKKEIKQLIEIIYFLNQLFLIDFKHIIRFNQKDIYYSQDNLIINPLVFIYFNRCQYNNFFENSECCQEQYLIRDMTEIMMKWYSMENIPIEIKDMINCMQNIWKQLNLDHLYKVINMRCNQTLDLNVLQNEVNKLENQRTTDIKYNDSECQYEWIQKQFNGIMSQNSPSMNQIRELLCEIGSSVQNVVLEIDNIDDLKYKQKIWGLIEQVGQKKVNIKQIKMEQLSKVSSQNIKYLLKVLSVNHEIRTIILNLSNNQLQEESYTRLFKEIGKQERLQNLRLNLQKNEITYEGVEDLEKMMDTLKQKGNPEIELDLRWNMYLNWRSRERMIEYSKEKENIKLLI